MPALPNLSDLKALIATSLDEIDKDNAPADITDYLFEQIVERFKYKQVWHDDTEPVPVYDSDGTLTNLISAHRYIVKVDNCELRGVRAQQLSMRLSALGLELVAVRQDHKGVVFHFRRGGMSDVRFKARPTEIKA